MPWSDKYSSVLETRISLEKELEEYRNKKIKNQREYIWVERDIEKVIR